MTTFEWISLFVAILGGFWVLADKLAKINVMLANLVTHRQCSERRHHCPALKEKHERRNR